MPALAWVSGCRQAAIWCPPGYRNAPRRSWSVRCAMDSLPIDSSENAAFLQVLRLAGQVVGTYHARLVQQRVVVEDRAQVAPVPVEVVRARGHRGAAGFEQL